jgi:hypothetical protein
MGIINLYLTKLIKMFLKSDKLLFSGKNILNNIGLLTILNIIAE